MNEAEESAVREEIRSWLAREWDPELPLAEWRGRLADSGWGCPSWPTGWYGRDLPADAVRVAREELDGAGAIGPAVGVGMLLVAPTLLEHGSDELRSRFLRRIVTGEDKWCQLFSEPGSGSDLAGLTTRATQDGDEWVVDGQKVWTSGAHAANYGLLLARTSWDVPKHAGITCFVLPMRQDGVEVRPLRQMNGHATFNEVFLTGARVGANDVIGAVDGGWRVGLTTLAHERGIASALFAQLPDAREGRAAREALEEAVAYASTYKWYPQRAGRADLVPLQARDTGRNGEHSVRQEVARVVTLERIHRWTGDRARASRAQGRPPGPEGSIAKLLASELARASARAHSAIAGANAMLSGPASPVDGVIAEVLLSVPAVSIAGGTDEIQRTIVGERVLGLPKEPQPDRDLPFREVPTNAVRARWDR